MAELTVARGGLSGADPDFQAAAGGGDTVPNDGNTLLVIDNASGGSITVTVDSPVPCNQGASHDVAIVVPAGTQRLAGPFPRARFGSVLSLTYTGVTSLTIAPVAP